VTWLGREFTQAKQRREQLPTWARPVLTRPFGPGKGAVATGEFGAFLDALAELGVASVRGAHENGARRGMVFVGVDDAAQIQLLLTLVGPEGDLAADWKIAGWTRPGGPTLVLDLFIPREQIPEVTQRLVAAGPRRSPLC
jgi:hypothetical protein